MSQTSVNDERLQAFEGLVDKAKGSFISAIADGAVYFGKGVGRQIEHVGLEVAAKILGTESETFDLDDGQTLIISVDGGANQTATFNTGDFVDINAATAAEVVAVIETDITGVTATDESGVVQIVSDTTGDDSSLQIDASSTAEVILGLDTVLHNGASDGLQKSRLFVGTDVFQGVVPSDGSIERNSDSFGDFVDGDAMQILKRGRVWVVTDDEVDDLSKSVFIRNANPGGSPPLLSLGSFRATTATDYIDLGAIEPVAWLGGATDGSPAESISGNAETYDLADGETLLMKIDGGSEDTATFNTADFVDIDAATAAEVAAVINTDITGVVADAYYQNGAYYVRIRTDRTDRNASIEITGGTATNLGFVVETNTGSGNYYGLLEINK